jgi:hypothetical protein
MSDLQESVPAGTHVWIPCAENVWKSGIVKEAGDGFYVVSTDE